MDGFPDAARTQGVAIFGKTGYGKSTLLQGFLEQSNHVRCFVFDPHGELTRNFLEELAELNPGKQYATLIIEPDMDYPFGLNIFECQDPSDQMEVDRVTDNVIRIFKKLWGDNPAFQPRMEHILLNVSKTLIANNLTMAEIPALLHDPQYRKRLVANVKNPVVVDYWRQEYEEIARRPLDRVQYIEAVSNRISQFLSNGFLYRVVSQAKSTLLFREWLEEDKWRYKPFLVRLPMGRLGEGVTNMLGSLILAALTNAIFARYNHMENPPRVHVLIDEWHRFYVPGLSGAVLLREGRKFNVGTVLTTQTIANLGSDEIDKQSVLQCGTLVCFALTGDDAELLAKQMQLPDPTGDYRQEPVIIPSPHAAQDIYTKGHPNERIMEIRKRLIVPLYEFLAKSEEEEKWLSHFSIVDKETEDYWTRTWGDAWGYRADHAQVELAVRKLNEYLYKCMQGEKRHFDPDHHKNYDREAFDILYPLRGFLGTHQAWMRHDNPRMMRYLELREQRVPVPEERWQEDVYTWEEWPFYPSEEEAWGLLIFLIMEGKVEEFGQFGFDGYVKERIQRLMLTFPSNMTLEANNKSEDWRKKQPEARARYEATQLIHATEDLLNLGLILSYAPVQTPSGKYQDVEYNRRTYADLRGELAHKLTNLAQYTFIIHRAGHQDVTPVLHVPIQSRFKESDIQAMYRVSREEIGREWSEVEAEIVNRRVPVQPAPAQKPIEPSGLPPAKPSI